MKFLKAAIVAFALAVSACVPANADAARAQTVEQRAHAATVRIDFDNGVCSGTVIGPHAILTATHCFKRPSSSVAINGSAVQIADRVDDGNDHSIIYVDRKFSNVVKLSAERAEQGDSAHYWGNPAGLKDVYRTGKLVAFDGDGVTEVRMELYDMNSFQGDSGAGIFNDRHELVGVVSGIFNFLSEGTYAKFMAALPLKFTPDELARATGK